PSLQLSGVPAVQVPFWQVSAPSHTVLLGQGVPLPTFACWQPLTASQESVVQGMVSLQLSGVPAGEVAFWQLSAPLHTVPSRHGVPLPTFACWQPLTASQESVVQALLSLQLSGVPAVQVPFWQLSAPLHTVPSRHGVPLPTFACWQPLTASQESV